MNTKKIILFVEDEPSLLAILDDKFSHEGFAVLVAKNGKEGLDLSMSRHPDLIFIDINLPVMTGIAMLQRIRSDPWGKNVKVVMLTNLDDYKNVAETLALRAYDYLVKSDWKIDDLVRIAHEKCDSPVATV